jgi:hypothetical protein
LTVTQGRIASRSNLFDLADWLAIAIVASLPWSTSATAILVVLWVIAFIPTTSWSGVRREFLTAAGGLPVLLFLLGAVGMLWADVAWTARLSGLDPFAKFLVIPLLLAHFRRSDRADWVFGSYLVSCMALLVVSYVMWRWFPPPHALKHIGVPVKNAPTQSGEFATCLLVLLYPAYERLLRRRWALLAGIAFLIVAMLANMFFVALGRTSLVDLLVLIAIFAATQVGNRSRIVLIAGVVLIAAAGWFSSSYLRARVTQIWTDAQKYEASDAANSSGERLEFYKKSIRFMRAAPILGHGTGSIHEQFIRSSIGKTGAAGVASTNPHNQTFAVGIQLGLIGVALLWVMWAAHVWLFRGGGLIAWIGLVVVVQNIVGSAFNSHLFDFLQGWTYVMGVGVAGGAVLKRRAASTLGTRKIPQQEYDEGAARQDGSPVPGR